MDRQALAQRSKIALGPDSADRRAAPLVQRQRSSSSVSIALLPLLILSTLPLLSQLHPNLYTFITPPNPTTTMSQYDQQSISRATSVSRKSTVASRNKSLISKQTAPHELKPSDILIERFTGE